MATAVIAGCGGIGLRHAQAACAVSDIDRVVIIEPNAARRDQVMSELRAGNPQIALTAFAGIDQAATEFAKAEIVVAAVTPDVTAEILETVVRIEALAYLFEKPVAQSAAGLDRLVSLLRRTGVEARTFVNCSRNLWQPYAAVRARYVTSAPARLHMEVYGALWGFGCNAVHFLELLRWVTGCREVKCVDARLSLSPLGNKRGKRFEEFVGTAAFCSDRGDTIELTSRADQAEPPSISVRIRATQGEPLDILVEETAGIVRDLIVRRQHAFKPAFVITTTQQFIDAALGEELAGLPLPAVVQAAVSHRALFQALSMATERDQFAIA